MKKYKLKRKSKRHFLLSESKIQNFNLENPQLADCIQGIKSSHHYGTTFESPFQGKTNFDLSFRLSNSFKNVFINLIINKSPKIVRVRRRGAFIIVCCKSELSKDLRYIIFNEEREYKENDYANKNQEKETKPKGTKRKILNVKDKRKGKKRNKKKSRKSKS